jgi:hypothetical protein
MTREYGWLLCSGFTAVSVGEVLPTATDDSKSRRWCRDIIDRLEWIMRFG